jgi:Lrp/AsnC family leucine-responsive transcriptional regulator
MPKELDSFDRRILRILQQEGRIPNSELAERVGLSATPCLRRVRALEQAGVIRGYRADIDRTKVGLGLTVIVGIKADGHHAESAGVIQRTFLDMPEVVSCQLVSGEADFLLEVVVPDLSGYERFLLGDLLTMPMVKDVHSSFVIRTVKDQGPFPIPD